MALPVAIPPQTGNKCVGQFSDGSTDYQLYCFKGNDHQGNPIYTCATWRLFYVSCPKLNQLCSTTSSAYVAAITVCNQQLFN